MANAVLHYMPMCTWAWVNSDDPPHPTTLHLKVLTDKWRRKYTFVAITYSITVHQSVIWVPRPPIPCGMNCSLMQKIKFYILGQAFTIWLGLLKDKPYILDWISQEALKVWICTPLYLMRTLMLKAMARPSIDLALSLFFIKLRKFFRNACNEK